MLPHHGEHPLPGLVQEAVSRLGVLLNTLFETAEDAIFIMEGLRFVDCNPATPRVFGFDEKAEIVGKRPFFLAPTRQPDGTLSEETGTKRVQSAIAGVPQRFEWRTSHKDRTEFDVEVRLNRFD